jgi:hypothetical protein
VKRENVKRENVKRENVKGRGNKKALLAVE